MDTITVNRAALITLCEAAANAKKLQDDYYADETSLYPDMLLGEPIDRVGRLAEQMMLNLNPQGVPRGTTPTV